MTKNKTMERFFDESDFTPSHDEMFADLIVNWKEYFLSILKHSFPIRVEGDIEGEPILAGYPPLFPDAIATGIIYENHTSKPLIVTFPEWTEWIEYSSRICYKCAICDRENFHETQLGHRPHEPYFWRESELEKSKAMESFKKELELWEKQKSDIITDWQKPRYWKDFCSIVKFKVIFEIKPYKESVGRILRQLNIYRSRIDQTDGESVYTVLITPDATFDKLFKSQGVIAVRPRKFQSTLECGSKVDGTTK